MIKGVVYSETLSLALSYRKSGNIEHALQYLKKACDLENDGLALFYMADAYEYGGWGLEKNLQKALIYARRSHNAGNPYGSWMYGSKMDIVYKEREESPFPRDSFNCYDLNDLRLYANEGDGPCQIKLAFELYDKENIDNLIESSLKQCVYDAYEFAGYYYVKQGKNLKTGLSYISKTRNDEILHDLPKNLKLMYAIGWAYSSTNLFKESPYGDGNEKRIYFETYEAVSNALTAWFIICKRIGLNKDLTKLIAQYILKFAEDPEEWGIYYLE